MAKLNEVYVVILDGRLVGAYTELAEARILMRKVLEQMDRFREHFREKYHEIPLEGIALVELRDSTISSLTSFARPDEAVAESSQIQTLPRSSGHLTDPTKVSTATNAVKGDAKK